ncbi:MAG: nitrilase/cyanide hydratase and apolipoprotein N-acyltransferase [Elusimicrobia bacterium]|nr:MAG: nitrilase/cyanide hydratase and apolipoprotein N-acyltransferase [Elusimicrobiota bacterium]
MLRAAMTQTVNAYEGMPARVQDLGRLKGHLSAVRDANLEHHAGLLREARKRGARAVCLGELFPAPYFALGKDPMWRGLAEDALKGPSVAAMRRAASDLGLVVVAPIYELDARNGRRYNTAVVIEQDGRVLGKYRKAHIPCGTNEQGSFNETFYYGRSDGGRATKALYPVFKTSVGRVGVSICYDRHFSGVAAALAAAGAQLVFSPAVTFGEKSRRMWELEFLVDAARHRLFIGGSNRLGAERPWNQRYFGAGYFAGPDGQKLPELSDHPNLVLADLDLGALGRPDPSGWNLALDARPLKS